MNNCEQEPVAGHPARGKALLPFLVFLIFYLGLSIWAGDFYKVSMPVAFIVASASAFLLSRNTPLYQKTEIYAHSMGHPDIMIMCMIFILAGCFAATAKGAGAVDSAVIIARNLVPQNLLLTGLFLISCFISIAVGTSCGTIAAVTPIAAGLVVPLQLNPGLLLGAVVGGAMFGDNLSMISDTTIAATRTQQVEMRDKFITNLKMVIPAAIIAIALYLLIGRVPVTQEVSSVNWRDVLAISPYILILVLAVCGINVMALLFCGTVLSGVIGIVTGKLNFWQVLELCGQGTLGMSETLIVAILAGGLLGLIRYNGGIDYILNLINSAIKSSRGCEYGVFVLVSLINLFTANNTVAIVIAGPIAREISLKYHCNPKRIASILDTASCAVQGIIPYGAQILIAVGCAQTAGVAISAPALLGYLYYPVLIGLSLLVWIFLGKSSRN